MYYNFFKEHKISALGLGMMRLPRKEDNTIDYEMTERMVDFAVSSGINYFDTAYVYHGGESETVTGKILSKYPRDSFYIATKYPTFIKDLPSDPSVIFEDQLRKCGVDYFDFYLLHNVCENTVGTFTDEKMGIIPYLLKQKENGRIRHLGFSSHSSPETLKTFLDGYGDKMEFCQIELNFLDWTYQRANEQYDIITAHGIPVWVMEPVRGGKLASLDPENEKRLKSIRPNLSVASWGFRWLQNLDNVAVILSGMSDMEQLADNLKTFESREGVSAEENEMLLNIAEKLKNSVPCTSCRYCTEECPLGIDIPKIIKAYNTFKLGDVFDAKGILNGLDEAVRPNACLGCGCCQDACPQKIDIPGIMEETAKLIQG